jgi:hypothetical protein
MQKNDHIQSLINLDAYTMLQSLPIELLTDGILQYVDVNDMRKLMLLSKDFTMMVKDIVYNDITSIHRLDTAMNTKEDGFSIKYIDIIESSIKTDIFDLFVKSMETKNEMIQINNLDIVFNYTIVSKKIMRNYLSANLDTIVAEKIDMQTPIFEIATTSHQDKDIEIFHFMLYLADLYAVGKARTIAKLSIIKQMLQYSDNLYMSRFAAICREEAYTRVDKLSQKTRQGNQDTIVNEVMKHSIYTTEVNIYNIYSMYTTDCLGKKYAKLLPVSAITGMLDDDLIYLKAQYKTCFRVQRSTLAILLHFSEYLNPIKLQIIGMIFHYLTDAIQHNKLSPLFATDEKFMKTCKNQCEQCLEDIPDLSNYNDDTLEIIYDILTKFNEI